jgi:excisionase family DNA binding protein
MSDVQLISVAEYAARVNLTEATVRRLARQGHIPATKIGRRVWRIDPDSPLPSLVPHREREVGEYPTREVVR